VELVAAATVEPGVAVEDDGDDDDVRLVARAASAVEVIVAVDAEVAEVVDNDHFEHIEVEIPD
jgi:hypothetical protein